VLETIERDRVTVFEDVPTMYATLLAYPYRHQHDVSSLRTCICGARRSPSRCCAGFEREFICTILEGYGLSERSPVACFNHPDRERLPGSIGIPVEGGPARGGGWGSRSAATT
jgi:long-chain acyl-CoA synthetase